MLTIFKGIRFLGVLAGWMIDEGLTQFGDNIATGALIILYRATPNPAISLDSFFDSTPWQAFMFFYGNACTVVGAFFTGCIAKSHRIKNGVVLWIFEELLLSYRWFRPSDESLWYHILDDISELGSACLGVWIAKLILGPGKMN